MNALGPSYIWVLLQSVCCPHEKYHKGPIARWFETGVNYRLAPFLYAFFFILLFFFLHYFLFSLPCCFVSLCSFFLPSGLELFFSLGICWAIGLYNQVLLSSSCGAKYHFSTWTANDGLLVVIDIKKMYRFIYFLSFSAR